MNGDQTLRAGGLGATLSEMARAGVERFPAAYLRLARRRTPTRQLLDRDTDLVIEGFPRSGNTYLVSWMSHANPGLRIASHLHSVVHVRAALRRHVPVVVVLREPEDAIASELILLGSVYGATPPIRPQLVRYERFYRGVERHLDRLTVSPFKTTTASPDRVVAALQQRSGLSLEVVPEADAAQVLDDVDRRTVAARGRLDELAVARPSAQRTDLRERVRSELQGNYGPALAKLRELHDSLVASSASAAN